MQGISRPKDGVGSGCLSGGQDLLLVFQPITAGGQLTTWIADSLSYIEAELVRAGVILFRGFGVRSAEELESLVRIVTPELVNYAEGSSPRIAITDKVYTSTEYPPEFDISLHDELSYAHRLPIGGQADSTSSA